MKTFQIGYKLYYGETSDWGTETIKAKNKQEALLSFTKKRSVERGSSSRCTDWRWNEGSWLAAFRYIKEVKLIACPHCCGIGVIPVNEEMSEV